MKSTAVPPMVSFAAKNSFAVWPRLPDPADGLFFSKQTRSIEVGGRGPYLEAARWHPLKPL